MAQKFTKDPDAVLDYPFSWSDWLATGETILSYIFTVETGLTLDSDSQADGIVTPWLSAGTAGVNYDVACEILTSAGRTDKRTIKIIVKNR